MSKRRLLGWYFDRLNAFPLAIHVFAANISDNQGGIIVLEKLKKLSARLSLIRTEAGYKITFEEAARKYGYAVECTQKLESLTGFIPQKGRWLLSLLKYGR